MGKNETHTLVVSSKAGREFLIRGLERKLRQNLGLSSEETILPVWPSASTSSGGTPSRRDASRAGLGRSLEEIVGLVVTRFAVQEHFP